MSTAKILVNNGINSVGKLTNLTIDQLTSMDGIGLIKAKAIYNSIQEKYTEITKLAQFVVFEEKTGRLMGKSFCITGKMEHPRKELEAMIIDAGGEVKKSVGKGLSYLVIADPDSTSSKAQKARKLGTKCISEAQFLEMIE